MYKHHVILTVFGFRLLLFIVQFIIIVYTQEIGIDMNELLTKHI